MDGENARGGRAPAEARAARTGTLRIVAGRLAALPAQAMLAADQGFSHLLLPPVWRHAGAAHGLVEDFEAPAPSLGADRLDRAAGQASAAGVGLLLDVVLDRVAAGGGLATGAGSPFAASDPAALLDPRCAGIGEGAVARLATPAQAAALADWWAARLRGWHQDGIAGFRLLGLARVPPALMDGFFTRLRAGVPGSLLLAWSPGLARQAVRGLAGADGVFASLPWWDGHADWLWDELDALRAVAPVLGVDAAETGSHAGSPRIAPGLAAVLGQGWLHVPADGEDAGALRTLNAALRDQPAFAARHAPIFATGEAGPVLSLLRMDAAEHRTAAHAVLAVVNTDRLRQMSLHAGAMLPAACGAFGPFADAAGARLEPDSVLALRPGECRVFAATARAASAPPGRTTPDSATQAAQAPRLAIEQPHPCVDAGRFPVKAIAGEALDVEADIVFDGHEKIAAALLWRPPGGTAWREVEMRPLGNDRWTAVLPLEALGRHHYAVLAWRDRFETFRDELAKKAAAGLVVSLELAEGEALVRTAAAHRAGGASNAVAGGASNAVAGGASNAVAGGASNAVAGGASNAVAGGASNAVAGGASDAVAAGGAFDAALARLRGLDDAARVRLLLAPELAELMRAADDRPHSVRTAPIPVDAERIRARYASWYEIFPRSMSDDPARHGTFADVARHLPRIAAMGFDVLYFPPISPIGRVNRKGRNNTLTPAPDDPGSPYAVGSEEGGHDALHPALGTLADFRALQEAAAAHGLEIAIDFAIQCSPDHPWLRQHRGWFDWRPDGSIKYAENPPKKYEDIVNVDFYAEDAIPGLWQALCDVVLFWAEQGIRIFRVDNPHTKPFPFWEWMIAEVRARYPEAMFLAEAFTRPKVMYRLAKIGFSQSYTYFTWRDKKAELVEYLEELNRPPVSHFFRPHFFVNTPDINPVFLQGSGRPGFLIRAALAATLSGLFGVYCGFELCEAAAVPGREEYLDSEKYQIRAWDWDREGNIAAEIAALNRMRRRNPALQSHLGFRALPAANDAVLFYEKATPDRANVVLVAVSLDPHAAQEADIDLPLWSWRLPDGGALEMDDLVSGTTAIWRGPRHRVRLTPEQPYAIWRARAAA